MKAKTFFRKLPIKQKLILIIMGLVFFITLISGISSTINESIQAQQNLAIELKTIQRIINEQSSAAIEFMDEKGAGDILQSLKLETSIIAACIYNETGDSFANYTKSSGVNFTCPKVSKQQSYFDDSYFHSFKDIIIDERNIGSSYILADLERVDKAVSNHIINITYILFVILIIAYFLASKLQKLICPHPTKTNMTNIWKITKKLVLEKSSGLNVRQKDKEKIKLHSHVCFQ